MKVRVSFKDQMKKNRRNLRPCFMVKHTVSFKDITQWRHVTLATLDEGIPHLMETSDTNEGMSHLVKTGDTR